MGGLDRYPHHYSGKRVIVFNGLRLDYGGLGPFCSIHADLYFFAHLLMFQYELYSIR